MPAIKCKHCERPATGEAYSMSVMIGVFCNLHGSRLLETGEADEAIDLDAEECPVPGDPLDHDYSMNF